MRRVAAFVVPLAVLAVAVAAGGSWVRSSGERPMPARHHDTRNLGSKLGYAPNHLAVIGDSYTAGGDEGGLGPENWTERAWQALAGRGMNVTADVAAEGGAGYGVRGNHGSLFADLADRAVRPDDMLVVFFGSRNDQDVDPAQLTGMIDDTFADARRVSPAARMLVIGPPWPTAEVPGNVLRIRDILGAQARAAGAEFVDPIADRWFVGRPELIGADGVHPTDAGHAYMADKIVPLISAQLRRPA